MNSHSINVLDFYKSGHHRQYLNTDTQKTARIYAYGTFRGSRLPGISFALWFGLQHYVMEYIVGDWNTNFFSKDIEPILAKYQRRMDNALGKGAVTTEHLRALHKLGYLPLRIKALPEGTLIPMRIPAYTVVNTHPEFFWLTNYIETDMSMNLWKAPTQAAIFWEYRRLFEEYFRKTVGDPNQQAFIKWQGHCFADRGMSYREDAAMTSAAFLTCFYGTDGVMGIDLLEDYYGANSDKEIVGGSVPATEHSVMCLGIATIGELETFRDLITKKYPSGPVSIVSDTDDYWQVLCGYALQLKSEILARTGSPIGLDKVIFRPDSSKTTPADIICGTAKVLKGELNHKNVFELLNGNAKIVFVHEDTYYESYFITMKHDDKHNFEWRRIDPTPEMKGSIRCLWEIFGGSITPLGYKQLNPKVGLIYGDSITTETEAEILYRLMEAGFASTNIVLGIGSYSSQYITRDSLGFAIKATYAEVTEYEDDELPRTVGYNLFKAPKTDKGIKFSAKGLLMVYLDDEGNLSLKQECTWEEEAQGLLETIFEDGKIVKFTTLEEIRKLVDQSL